MTTSSAPLYPQQDASQSQSLKVCNTCFRKLPTTSFEKANYGTSLRGDCKDCRKAKRKLSGGSRKKPTVSNPVLVDFKMCARCGTEKSASEFTFVATSTTNLHSYCKDCKRSLERERAISRANNKRKALHDEYESMDPTSRPMHKICGNANCHLVGELQPPENFDKSPLNSSGLRMDCRLCELDRRRKNPVEASRDYHNRWYQEHKEELNKRTKEWREANRDEVRRLHIERRFRQYGVTEEWYDKTLAEQGGGCAICGSKDPKSNGDTFHVDHYHGCCAKGCHACDNCRRGLLCSPCNTRLAHLENLTWKRQAIAYLNKYKRKDAAGNDQPSLFDGL